MTRFNRVAIITALSIPLLAAGCAGHARVYVWGPGETTYYSQWEVETHRQHTDWEKRNDADHQAYWKWRRRHDH